MFLGLHDDILKEKPSFYAIKKSRNQQTDLRTDRSSYRDARTHLEIATPYLPEFINKWYCAVKKDIIKATTLHLNEAQKSLNLGNSNNRQAIIPMLGFTPMHPKSLAKKWRTGSMWWAREDEVKKWQELCRGKVPSGELMNDVLPSLCSTSPTPCYRFAGEVV